MKKFILLIVLMLVCSPVLAYDYCGDAVGCWLFTDADYNGGSGTTVDDASPNTNTGNFKGAGEPAWASMTGTNAPTYAPYLVDFDGTDDYINAGSDASVDNLSNRTYTAWIYPNSVGENSLGYIIGKIGGTNGFSFNLQGTAAIGLTHTGTSILYRIGASNSITLNTWNHVQLTWGGALNSAESVHIYVNGTEISYATTTNGSGTVDDAGGNLCIGNRTTDTARTFDGNITDVGIFSTILNSTQLSAIYDYGLQPTSIASLPSVLSDSVWADTTFN